MTEISSAQQHSGFSFMKLDKNSTTRNIWGSPDEKKFRI